MKPAQAEAFYDREIAPRLLELQQICEHHGMSFVALVEWAPEHVGVTSKVLEGASAKALVANWGARCFGNIDSLMIAAQRHAEKHGHSSTVLSILGCPHTSATESGK